MHRLANLQCVTPRDHCILTVIVICATDQPWILLTPSVLTTAQSTSMDLLNKPRCTLPTATASYTNPVPVHTTVPATTPSHPLLSPIMRLRPTLEPSMALHTTPTHRPASPFPPDPHPHCPFHWLSLIPHSTAPHSEPTPAPASRVNSNMFPAESTRLLARIRFRPPKLPIQIFIILSLPCQAPTDLPPSVRWI